MMTGSESVLSDSAEGLEGHAVACAGELRYFNGFDVETVFCAASFCNRIWVLW